MVSKRELLKKIDKLECRVSKLCDDMRDCMIDKNALKMIVDNIKGIIIQQGIADEIPTSYPYRYSMSSPLSELVPRSNLSDIKHRLDLLINELGFEIETVPSKPEHELLVKRKGKDKHVKSKRKK